MNVAEFLYYEERKYELLSLCELLKVCPFLSPLFPSLSLACLFIPLFSALLLLFSASLYFLTPFKPHSFLPLLPSQLFLPPLSFFLCLFPSFSTSISVPFLICLPYMRFIFCLPFFLLASSFSLSVTLYSVLFSLRLSLFFFHPFVFPFLSFCLYCVFFPFSFLFSPSPSPSLMYLSPLGFIRRKKCGPSLCEGDS